MRIVISAHHFAWDSMSACLRHAKESFGLDGVELSFNDSYTHPHCTAEDIDQVRSVNEGLGLDLHAHIWEDIAQLGPDRAGDALLHWLGVCGRTGVENLVIHGGSYPDRREGIVRTRRALERVMPAFESAGVVLCLENHYAYEYRDCQELFSEVWEFEQVFAIDSPSLRFCFDTGHGNMTGNSSDLIRRLGRYLKHVHLADNHGVDDDHCAYMQGTVAWESDFDSLVEVGFDGAFCVEYPVRDDLAPFRQCIADLARRWRRQS